MKVLLIVIVMGFGNEPIIQETVPMKDLAHCEAVAAKLLRIEPPADARSISTGCIIQIAPLASQ